LPERYRYSSTETSESPHLTLESSLRVFESTRGLIEATRDFRTIEPTLRVDRVPDPRDPNGREDANRGYFLVQRFRHDLEMEIPREEEIPREGVEAN
jgi:hypothetical protein